MKQQIKLWHLFIHILTLISIIVMIALFIYWYKLGVLSSTEALQGYIAHYGQLGVMLFIAIQIFQVIIPILPGAVTSIVGVLIYGTWIGFIYNYIGICVGSVIAFILARHYGQNFVKLIIGDKLYNKYFIRQQSNQKFLKLFVFLMFFPVAPDDVLCYVAGLTKMRFRTFLIILLLSKPLALFTYSYGMAKIGQYVWHLLGF